MINLIMNDLSGNDLYQITEIDKDMLYIESRDNVYITVRRYNDLLEVTSSGNVKEYNDVSLAISDIRKVLSCIVVKGLNR